MLVMLSPKWEHEEFRRTVRDAAGQVLRVLVFSRGAPQQLDDPDDRDAVKLDLGRALVLIRAAEPTDSGKKPIPGPRGPRVDWDATAQEAAAIAADLAEEQELQRLERSEQKARTR